MKITAKLVVVFLLISFSSIPAMCQTAPAPLPLPDGPSAPQSRTTADETFDLNISERRFTRVNFEASTALRTDGDSGLDLQIGVGMAAGKIDVLLRNVQGRVRFQGTLERILNVLNNRRATP